MLILNVVKVTDIEVCFLRFLVMVTMLDKSVCVTFCQGGMSRTQDLPCFCQAHWDIVSIGELGNSAIETMDPTQLPVDNWEVTV